MPKLALLVLLAALPALPRSADAQSGLIVFGHAGRAWPAVDLSDAGDRLTSAFTYGAGVALQIGGRIALRGSLTRSAPGYRGTTVALADSGMTRTYLGGDLQVGWPGTTSLVPYVVVGGGVMQSDPADGSQGTVTDVAGRLGLGANRLIGVGAVFLEVTATGYKFTGLGFDRLQIDVTLQAGLALAVPF
ncbi:MAG: hypothetical protein PVF27_02710 [Gemmatimonadales bacterium]